MVCPYTRCRFSIIRAVTRHYGSCHSSVDSANNRLYLADCTPVYTGLTGKGDHFCRRLFALPCRKTKNILDTALYFNGGYCHLSSFYSGRKGALINRKLFSYQRSIAERFGKSPYSTSDDFSFAVDAAGTDSISGIAWDHT